VGKGAAFYTTADCIEVANARGVDPPLGLTARPWQDAVTTATATTTNSIF